MKKQLPEVLSDYISEYKLVGRTIFWQPEEQYNDDFPILVQIEQSLNERLTELGVENSYFVHYRDSLQGIESFFEPKNGSKNGWYVRNYYRPEH